MLLRTVRTSVRAMVPTGDNKTPTQSSNPNATETARAPNEVLSRTRTTSTIGAAPVSAASPARRYRSATFNRLIPSMGNIQIQ